MRERTANIKTARKCAFCKNWRDPADEVIWPKDARVGLWSYDEDAERVCLIRNRETRSNGLCNKYKCKL